MPEGWVGGRTSNPDPEEKKDRREGPSDPKSERLRVPEGEGAGVPVSSPLGHCGPGVVLCLLAGRGQAFPDMTQLLL